MFHAIRGGMIPYRVVMPYAPTRFETGKKRSGLDRATTRGTASMPEKVSSLDALGAAFGF